MARSLGCIVRQWKLVIMAGFLLTIASCGMAQEPASPSTPDPAAAATEASASAEDADRPSQTIGPELSKAEAKIAKALDTPTPLEFFETPLTDIAAFLAEYHDIAVRFDERALEDAGIALDMPITFQVDKIKLRNALKLMLGKKDLGVHIRHEALFITTYDYLRNEVSTQVYSIYDLLGQDRDGEGEAWVDIIVSTVSPDSWDEQGGPGAIASYRGRLVVTQTDEVHSQLQSLLSGMRKYHLAAKAAPGKPLPTVIECEDGGRGLEAWNAILAKELNLEFVDTPLSDVILFLSDKLGVPVKLDERALEDSAIPFDLPITYSQQGVSLRAALAVMLAKHDLNWVISNEVLLITTNDVACEEVFTRIYPVADLVRTSDGTLDSWQLMEVLQSTVMPASWADQGGPGAATPSPNEDVLFITQTVAAHDEVSAVLVKLRRAAPQEAAGAEGSPKPNQGPAETPDHSRRLKVFDLYESVDVEPLAEMAREMFEPDNWPAPEGSEVRKAVVAGVPGRIVVRHEQAFIDLIADYLEQNEGLASSTRSRQFDPLYGWPTHTPVFALGEHSQLTVRCYRLPAYWPEPQVGSAEVGLEEKAKPPTEPKSLPRDGKQYEPLVRELVLPGSWGEAGPGRVHGLPGLLIVRHTPEGQREVAKLLKRLMSPHTPAGVHGQNYF